MNGLGFVWREALAGLRRNVTMSVAMMLTTAISLGMLGAGLLGLGVARGRKKTADRETASEG